MVLRQQVSHKSDTYALGIVAWEMFSGARPWAGQPTLQVAYQVRCQAHAPPCCLFGWGSHTLYTAVPLLWAPLWQRRGHLFGRHMPAAI